MVKLHSYGIRGGTLRRVESFLSRRLQRVTLNGTQSSWHALLEYHKAQSSICAISRRFVVAVWLSGNVVGQINEVILRRAGLILRWVTVRGYTVLVFNQATQANSAWSSLRG